MSIVVNDTKDSVTFHCTKSDTSIKLQLDRRVASVLLKEVTDLQEGLFKSKQSKEKREEQVILRNTKYHFNDTLIQFHYTRKKSELTLVMSDRTLGGDKYQLALGNLLKVTVTGNKEIEDFLFQLRRVLLDW